jgi:hypothetical protein
MREFSNLICGFQRDVQAVQQAKRTPLPSAFIFFKLNTTITGQTDPVLIPKTAQDYQADYKCELVTLPFAYAPTAQTTICALHVLVIGKDGTDVPRRGL